MTWLALPQQEDKVFHKCSGRLRDIAGFIWLKSTPVCLRCGWDSKKQQDKQHSPLLYLLQVTRLLDACARTLCAATTAALSKTMQRWSLRVLAVSWDAAISLQ